MSAGTGSNAMVYWVRRVCPGMYADEGPCEIAEIDHYGVPTGHLWCGPHGEVVGYVVRPGER